MEKLYSLIALIMLANILVDWYLIRRQIWIQHSLHTAVAAMAYTAAAVISWCWFSLSLYNVAATLVMVPATRWLVHDLALNLARGLPADYLGSSDKSAGTDKLLQVLQQKGINQWAVKVFFFAGSLIFYIIIHMFKFYS
jgi:hypothetical protein